tara:strand:- start:320 stop:700 length:381 start_codon:yes stop_codon:yes gene_type:complete
MNTKERYLWIGALIIALLFCDRKISQVERLEDLDRGYQLNARVQSDQINELVHKSRNIDSSQYNQGFEDGKAHAMIAAIHNDNLYDYAEGYHAAINQLSEELSNEELKKQVSSYIDKLVNNINKKP